MGLRVLIADDSALLREGLSRVLGRQGFSVVAALHDATAILTTVDAVRPDVAVIDVRMPPGYGDEGIRAAESIGESHPGVGVLVLSQYVEPHYALNLLERRTRGAGYLLKDSVGETGVLGRAVLTVAAGGSFVDPAVVERLAGARASTSLLSALSERERDVLRLMSEGRSNTAICKELYLSPKTVEVHVRNVFSKLDLPPAPDDHRRVLAVLRYLSAS